jgi:hypothetical protein
MSASERRFAMPLNYAESLRQKGRPHKRPTAYEALLFEPIADAPSNAGPSYTNWEFDHGRTPRFYVGGLLWFMRVSGIPDIQSLAEYGSRAVEEVEKNTIWAAMPNSGENWKDCSLNQFRYARLGRAVYFQKAALVIVACEIALTETTNDGRIVDKSVSPDDVHHHMSIVPAVWNIDSFNPEYLTDLNHRHPNAKGALRDAAGQRSTDVIDRMAEGYTVTSSTALDVKKYIDGNFREHPVGNVRAHPGRKRLGRLRATDDEIVDAN